MGIISFFFFSTAADDVQRSQRQKEVKHLMTIKEEEIQWWPLRILLIRYIYMRKTKGADAFFIKNMSLRWGIAKPTMMRAGVGDYLQDEHPMVGSLHLQSNPTITRLVQGAEHSKHLQLIRGRFQSTFKLLWLRPVAQESRLGQAQQGI